MTNTVATHDTLCFTSPPIVTFTPQFRWLTRIETKLGTITEPPS